MKLTVVGSGDAFGSGGRLQTCYHLAVGGEQLLLDCGATVLIGMDRLGLDPNRVSTIFISHLHGDHFAGLVWWMLYAHYETGRTEALTVVGPRGIAARFAAATEVLFPNSAKLERRFELGFIEYAERQPVDIAGVRVTPYEVLHPSGAPPYALRLESEGKVLGFSGDTKWVESLLPVADGADLFICESYHYDSPVGYHMAWREIEANLDRLGAKRLMLTHMGRKMLARLSEVRDGRVFLASDGLVVDI